jgi:hypothetical protein
MATGTVETDIGTAIITGTATTIMVMADTVTVDMADTAIITAIIDRSDRTVTEFRASE